MPDDQAGRSAKRQWRRLLVATAVFIVSLSLQLADEEVLHLLQDYIAADVADSFR